MQVYGTDVAVAMLVVHAKATITNPSKDSLYHLVLQL